MHIPISPSFTEPAAKFPAVLVSCWLWCLLWCCRAVTARGNSLWGAALPAGAAQAPLSPGVAAAVGVGLWGLSGQGAA